MMKNNFYMNPKISLHLKFDKTNFMINIIIFGLQKTKQIVMNPSESVLLFLTTS